MPHMNRAPSHDGKREMTMQDFKQWLRGFDLDNDGRISRNELREAIKATGARFSGWKSKRALKDADSNGDGFIDTDEVDNLVEFAKKNMGIKVVLY